MPLRQSWVWRKLAGAKVRAKGAWFALRAGSAKHGSRDYLRRAAEERRHYAELFYSDTAAGAAGRESLMEPAPPVWMRVENLAAERIRALTGNDIMGHLIGLLRGRPQPKLISLGSGPGGIELALAREVPEADYLCVDFNPALLALGQASAQAEGLPVRFQQADLNTLELPRSSFDVVFCHASLHHVVALEHLFAQIHAALAEGGKFVVVDVIARSGYRMWPETRKVVQAIWRTLPEKFRVNHVFYPEPRIDEEIWDGDTRVAGMECIRSEELLPLLDKTFRRLAFVPYYSISRRFFDRMYGPNYDLNNSLDLAIMHWIWELDCYYLLTSRLRPESFFGIYEAVAR